MAIVSDKQRRALLLWTGVKLSKDGKSIFNYNPGIFHAGLNFLVALPFLPGFINRGHIAQCLVLLVLMQVYMWGLSDATADKFGMLDVTMQDCYANIAGLSRFVLGLFVSLLLSQTYYANRGFFGTVFGGSMGLTQMIVVWVRVPPNQTHNIDVKKRCVKETQEMIVRWISAAFRLMWLEAVPGSTDESIGKEMVEQNLLTQGEWDKLVPLSSKCSHIYTWIGDVLSKLADSGYIASANQLVLMHQQVDNMRGANVWGLPSLPIAYTQIITHMVKAHLFVQAWANGSLAKRQIEIADRDGYDYSLVISIIVVHLDLIFHNYLFQGLLDLHGALYNPNSGIYLGHLPALNFMNFVKDVTEHMVTEHDSLPYKLDLVRLDDGAGKAICASADTIATGVFQFGAHKLPFLA